MVMFKKLIFAPIFLAVFTILIYQLAPLLKSYDLVFSLSLNMTIKLIGIAALVAASSFLFTLFASLASDWKISLAVGVVAAIIPFILIPSSFALIFAVGIFISLLLTNLSLDTTLKTYINFQPSAILGPSIRHLSTLLIVSFCLIYFFSVTKIIAQDSFQLPDSLIDTALKMAPLPTEQTQLPSISPDQIAMLKKNPDLLRQSGLDPEILDSLNQPTQGITNDLVKQTVKDQIENFIKPFINFIPGLLTILLFFTLQSLTSILNLLIYPLLWLIFFIMEKTGFVKFEIEQRQVKKLVV